MYQGINDTYLNAENNFVFELQFHTPESWELKSEAHIIYEKFRVSTDPIEQMKLFEEGTRKANTVRIPEKVMQLIHLTINPEPDMLSAYSHVLRVNYDSIKDPIQNWLTSHLQGKGFCHVRNNQISFYASVYVQLSLGTISYLTTI